MEQPDTVTVQHMVDNVLRCWSREDTADDVASLVFLASLQASSVTGASNIIDGGRLAWRGSRAD
jgi:hypothetical protein